MAGWSWRLTDAARYDFEALDPDDRQRIVRKLEDIWASPWQDARLHRP